MVKRWIDIFQLAIVGTLFSAILLLYSKTVNSWLFGIPRTPSDMVSQRLLALCALAVFVAIIFLLKKCPFSRGHLLNTFRYPSTWIGVLLAAIGTHVVVALFYQSMGTFRAFSIQSDLVLADLVFAVFFTLACGHIKVQQWITNASPASSNSTAEGSKAEGCEQAKLEEWIRSEQPVRTPETDYLNRSYIAKRMAKQVLDGSDRTIGLAGGFGTGKSSLIELMQYFLPEEEKALGKKAIVSRVSCWGFEDSNSALRHILATAIGQMGKHVDVLAFEDLPDDYVDLLSGTGGWLRPIIGQFAPSAGPEEKLRLLTPVLQAINKKLIIVVEDLDRNDSPTFDRQQVLATLSVIRDVPEISFILAGSSSTHEALSFARLCDQIETMPSLKKEDVYTILKNARERCLSRFNDTIVGRGNNEFESNPMIQLRYYANPELRSRPFALAKLLHTPRSLKHALRKTDLDWETLHGEVVFEELLALNVLRTSAPLAFDFILQNYDSLAFEQSRGSFGGSDENKKKRQEYLNEKWDELTVGPDNWDHKSARTVVCSLFPSTNFSTSSNARPYSMSDHPQAMGVMHNKHYFDRIVTGQFEPDSVRDQYAIKTILEFNETDDTSIITNPMLNETGYCPIWERFNYLIDRNKLLPIATQLFETCLNRDGSEASGQEEAIIAVWRAANQAPNANAIEWICSELEKACKVSLRFTNDVFYFWGSERYPIGKHDQTPQMRNRARQKMSETIKGLYLNKPVELVKFLDGGAGRSAYELCHLIFVDGEETPLNKPSDWEFLSSTIVDAAELEPSVVLPRVVHLIEHRDQRSQTTTSLNLTMIDDFFGLNASRLMQILANRSDVLSEWKELDEAVIARMAKEWYTKKEAASGNGHAN